MKRIFLMIFIILFLAGCAPGRKQLVVYLSLLPSEEKIYQELIERFQFLTGVEITLISQQYNQIKQAIESEVKAKKGVVDVFEVDLYYIEAMARFAEDLSGLEGYFKKMNLYEDAFELGKIDNKLLFVPHRISCQAVIYNSKYIETPPETWKDFAEIAKNFPGKIGLKASLYEGLVCDIFPIVWAYGGDIFNLDNENTQKALEIIKTISENIHPASRGYKENTILEAQAREEIYLHLNWPFAVNYLKEKGLFPEPNKISVIPEAEGRASVLGGGYLAISKVAPHKKEAEQFLRFIETSSSQSFLLKNLGWLPARKDIWDSLIGSEIEKDYVGFIRSLKYARCRPVSKDYPRLSYIWQKIFYSLAFEGNSVKDVIEKFKHDLDSIRHEDR